MTERQQTLLESAVPAPPRAGEYQTVYSDPPWLERGAGKIKRGADRHYPLMSTHDICHLPVNDWAADDAHCYIWVTNNFLQDGLDVMRFWGFRYITKIDWFKGPIGEISPEQIELVIAEETGVLVGKYARALDVIDVNQRVVQRLLTMQSGDDDTLQVGLGQYFRGVTESCLFGVRGNVPYQTLPNGKRAQGRTGFHAPRGEHSAKPETMRQMIERVSPGPRLEMFARRPAEGWDLWGFDAPEAAEVSDGKGAHAE